MKPKKQVSLTKPSPVTADKSVAVLKTWIKAGPLTSSTTQELLQFVYVNLPSMCSGALVPATVSPKNKTSHSTVGSDKSFALPTDVSCTWVTSVHDVSESFEHSTVDSAIADEAPTNAIASSAASAARPSILIGFT